MAVAAGPNHNMPPATLSGAQRFKRPTGRRGALPRVQYSATRLRPNDSLWGMRRAIWLRIGGFNARSAAWLLTGQHGCGGARAERRGAASHTELLRCAYAPPQELRFVMDGPARTLNHFSLMAWGAPSGRRAPPLYRRTIRTRCKELRRGGSQTAASHAAERPRRSFLTRAA